MPASEVLRIQAKPFMGKRTEIHHLIGKGPDFGESVWLRGKKLRITVLQVRSAGSAQGQDHVMVSRERLHILQRHILSDATLPHHDHGQAAA